MKKFLLLLWMLPLAAMAQMKVCLVSASAEYGSHESLAKLQAELEKKGVACFRAFGEDKGNGVPGLEKLAESDVLVLFTRRIVLPPEQMEVVRRHVEAGKGIVGIRTASHGIQNWVPDVKAFDKEVLGGSYDNHYKKDEPADVTADAANASHPVLKDVPPFQTTGKLYKNPALAPDVTLLLTAVNAGGNKEPVAWSRAHHGGRVFYTSLGVQSDFDKPEFLRLMVNAVLWAGGE